MNQKAVVKRVKIPVDSITVDKSIQTRAGGTNAEVVCEYAEVLDSGRELPDVVVFDDGRQRWLADGFHTHAAHVRAGRGEIGADVRQGTRRDALFFACGANAAHGLRRTNADKRNVVSILLADPEWSKLSDREIARHCSVSHPFVSKVRDEPSGNRYQIASPSAHSGQENERTVSRGGSTYTMHTANINKGRQGDGGAAGPPVQPTRDDALRFACEVCGERLDVPTWHCPGCNRHLPLDAAMCPECELPRPAGAAAPSTSGVNGDQDGDVQATDAVGLPLSGDSAAAFAVLPMVEEAERMYRKLAEHLDRLAQMPGMEWYRKRLRLERRGDADHFACPDLDNSRRELVWSRPYASACPTCYPMGVRTVSCPTCHGLPYVVKEMWERCPEEQREAVKALARRSVQTEPATAA
jgi:hypothetical protein